MMSGSLKLLTLTPTLCDGQDCALLDGGRRGEAKRVHAPQQRVPQLHALERVDDLQRNCIVSSMLNCAHCPCLEQGAQLQLTLLCRPSQPGDQPAAIPYAYMPSCMCHGRQWPAAASQYALRCAWLLNSR
jgi:hypothetical protein